MAKPVMTRELMHERTVPACPHCGGDMDAAAVKLWDIVDAATEGKDEWRVRIDNWVAVDAGGFADADKGNVVVECPACCCPSVLVLDGLSVKLFAARTPIDKRFLEAKEERNPR